jgi:glycosyltransferase involved in cell wall biosynthesis
MKICIVVHDLEKPGGWCRLARGFESYLVPCGIEVGFITQASSTSGPGVLIARLRNISWRHPLQLGKELLRIRKFAKGYDVVLCFDANPYGVLVTFALLGSGVPLVLYTVGTYSLLTRSFLRNILIRFAYAHADKILAVSEFIKEQVEKSGLRLPNATIVPVGVDPGFFYPVQDKPATVSTPYVLSVGPLKSRKGLHISVEAFIHIAPEFPHLSYVIVGNSGDDAYARALKQKVKEHQLEKRVVFLENIPNEELRSLYSFAEFFLLTPITTSDSFEGFGMVYLEAASCGITAIGTNDSGAREAILDKETGLLVATDPLAVADAMRVLLRDPELRVRLSKAAKTRAGTFAWNEVTHTLIAALSDYAPVTNSSPT